MKRPSPLTAQGQGRFVTLKMDRCQDITGGCLSTLHREVQGHIFFIVAVVAAFETKMKTLELLLLLTVVAVNFVHCIIGSGGLFCFIYIVVYS